MKKSALFALMAALALSAASKSQAAPVPVTLTLVSSSVLLRIDVSGLVTTSVNVALSGTQNILLSEPAGGGVIPSFQFTGGDIDLADTSLSLVLPAGGGTVDAELIGVGTTGLTNNGVIPLTFTGGTWAYSFDPGGPVPATNKTSVTLNSGFLTYIGTGTLGGLLGSGTQDFGASPAGFELPALGQIGTLTQSLLGSTGVTTTYRVVLTAPVTVSDDLITDPVAVAATLSGNIVATGTYTLVPEPSTVILAGIGLIALVPYARRRFSRTG